MLNLHLPHEAPLLHAAHNEVLLVSNADLRESAFGFSFATREVRSMKNVGDLIDLIAKKTG